MMNRKLQNGLSHALLVNILELTQNLDQKVILIRAAMTYINENLPRLQNHVHELEMLESTPLSQNIERWQFKIAVDLTSILVERRPKWCKLAEFALELVDEGLLQVIEAPAFTQKWDRVNQEENSVSSVLWQLVCLAICAKVNQHLSECLDQTLIWLRILNLCILRVIGILILYGLKHGESYEYFGKVVEFESLNHLLHKFNRFFHILFLHDLEEKLENKAQLTSLK